MDSPHQGPVMPKVFPCRDVIMHVAIPSTILLQNQFSLPCLAAPINQKRPAHIWQSHRPYIFIQPCLLNMKCKGPGPDCAFWAPGTTVCGGQSWCYCTVGNEGTKTRIMFPNLATRLAYLFIGYKHFFLRIVRNKCEYFVKKNTMK